MPEETILKKDGVKIVKKRLRELLKPRGFQPCPHTTTRLVRVREEFIDEVRLDTGGYHLDADYYIYLRSAPFAWLKCDSGRLWRAAREHISTHLNWYCEIPPEGGPYYYEPEHFEAVWRDVAYALERHILPQMEAMTEEVFLSRLLERSRNDQDFFLADRTVSLTDPYYPSTPETAVYGVSLWRLGRYEEGIPYLTFARKKYRDWLAAYQPEDNHFYRWHVTMLALLDDLLALWEEQGKRWDMRAQRRIRQAAINWTEYML